MPSRLLIVKLYVSLKLRHSVDLVAVTIYVSADLQKRVNAGKVRPDNFDIYIIVVL